MTASMGHQAPGQRRPRRVAEVDREQMGPVPGEAAPDGPDVPQSPGGLPPSEAALTRPAW